jgi:hypothetical protein
MMEAAMGRVLTEADEAKTIFSNALVNDATAKSRQAYEARQHLTKSAFDELRSASVRYGGRMTADFLDLETKIDHFKSEFVRMPSASPDSPFFVGLHEGFEKQLAIIETKAEGLHSEAVTGKTRAMKVIVATEDLVSDIHKAA